MMVVSWFSCGVSSAVATKLALQDYPDMEIIYQDIEDQHPDSKRFLHECEQWFGKKITIQMSNYRNVENVVRQFRWINGSEGAKCTGILKRRVRQEWEIMNKPTHYVWGFDCSERERKRAARSVEHMGHVEHIFPLIDKGITKKMAHGMLQKSSIKRPAMYDLGYPNNNCIGCVKGGAGYWNKIRIDFPEVFKKRAELERLIGASCMHITNPKTKETKKIWLDELNPNVGRKQKIILLDCGMFCEQKESPHD